MANYACISIGINRYQFLQPLNYGQADAWALQQFLVEQANLPASDCLLLTDTSPPLDRQSTYPNRETIWRCLETTHQNSPTNGMNSLSKNWRWFFFSGYGVCWEGVDYLMPIDANPHDIPGTGIPMRSLLNSLKQQSHDNLLLLLDINRSPGVPTGTLAGAETVELARQMGMAVILSAQLDQFSHEAAALGNGLFTATLLEALRYHQTGITLAELEQYLRDRLPELSQHHWRPIQTPLIIIPSEDTRQHLILPAALNSLSNEKTAAAIASTLSSGTNANIGEVYGEGSNNGATAPVEDTPSVSTGRQPVTSLIPASPSTLHYRPLSLMSVSSSSQEQDKQDGDRKQWWQQWRFWVGGAALVLALLIAAVGIRNRYLWREQQATQPTETEKLLTEEGMAARVGKSQSSPTPDASPTAPPTVVSVNPSPAASPTPQPEQPATATPTSQPERLQANQTALAKAKGLIQPNQASLFSQAIAQARTIKPGEPLYEQAQQDINRWSQVILDLAEGRAKQGNFQGAIAAARLVPQDNPSVYTKAQQSINRWTIQSKQQQQNQALLQSAKQQLRRNQASSYNRAIATLRKVPVGQPGYAEAQQLTAQWSRQIYLIANSRAWRGNFQQAVQTAALVPPNTPSYEAAQKAIAQWKQGSGGAGE
ncbi:MULTISPECIES: caspase family protein [unclassified Coleofasciculus]|uniref:caspase family protein n=1 Tax=unclassified Coleofasciculus TaxID=2692782 RepID=UPI00187FD3E8|nr:MULTISPECIES: caspase family protein [unclassified Coleofasciculus]MBE9129471.1 caspase family protein [Coleofasciculus sp. LEGE 07081]MBE9152093.1 caspase family protein [Coleofasciculus sp. LEGE 07092]